MPPPMMAIGGTPVMTVSGPDVFPMSPGARERFVS
jgi:hypothetical protein